MSDLQGESTAHAADSAEARAVHASGFPADQITDLSPESHKAVLDRL